MTLLTRTEQSKEYAAREHIVDVPVSATVHEFKVSMDQTTWPDTDDVLGSLVMEISQDGVKWTTKATIAVHKIMDEDKTHYLATNDMVYRAINHSKEGRMRIRFIPNRLLVTTFNIQVAESPADKNGSRS